jgi:hypothetical protein
MKKKIFLLLALPLGCLNSQTSITLPASKDAAIGFHDGANTGGNNYGYAVQNAAFCMPSVAGPGVNANRALIDFNLSAIPPGATIISAHLNLYAVGPFGSLPGHTGTNNSCYLQRVTQSWAENSVTWNNQPPASIQNQVTLAASANSTQDYLNINVTNLVIDMINNQGNSFGFLLKLVNQASTNSLAFASKDYSDPNKAPTLVVIYEACKASITLDADYDAAIGYHDGANTAGNNYGFATQNAAFAIPSAAGPGLNVNRALLHFDLSPIPLTATITGAQLDLFAYGYFSTGAAHSGPANDCFVERVTSAWTETGVTWNNQPTTSTANQLTLIGTNNTLQDYLNINLTTIVQDIFSSSNNYGIMLRLQAENASNLLSFCSKDHPDSAKHPKLRIDYISCEGSASTSIPETKLNTELSLFPNPTTNSVSIKYNVNGKKNAAIIILDTQGKVVGNYSLDTKQNYFEITGLKLENGLYNCVIVTDGELISSKKLIIIK